MRIAVCFSTQIRTGVKAAESIKKYIGDLWPYCTFFLHTWDINTKKPYNFQYNIEPNKYPLSKTEFEKFLSIYNITSERYEIENFDSIKKYHSDNNFFFIPVYYSWRKSIEIYKNNEKLTEKYDLVLKIRPDIIFEPGRTLSNEIANSFVKYDKNKTFFGDFAEIKQNDGWINDVFFFSIPEIMDLASKSYNFQIKNPYEGLKKYLNSNNIDVKRCFDGLKNWEYTIYREESLTKNPIDDFYGCVLDEKLYYNPIPYRKYVI
jgi:hypothetical protein